MTQPIRELATGFGNDAGNTEGPMWWKGGGYLLLHWQRWIKYTAGQGTSVFKEPTNGATGSRATLRAGSSPPSKRPGKWLATIPMAASRVIANKFHGKRLNRPNDVVVKSESGFILPIRSTGRPSRLS
jgi:gluconolactonase